MAKKTSIQGSAPFRVTHRQVLEIAIPMTLAYLTTPLLGLVGTAVVGRFGDAALVGGLAAGAAVFDIVFAAFNFLRSGTTALVAQAFGRNDALEEKAVFWRALVIAAISGLGLVLFSPLIAVVGEWFMNTEPRVTAAMDLYIRVRLIAAPAAFINYTILGYLLGSGNSVLGLLMQLLLNGMNVALSILLCLYLGWGISGVAWGTVFSEGVAMVAGMTILLVRFRAMPKMSRQLTFNMVAIGRMLYVSGDIVTPSCMLLGAYMLFTRQSAQLGALTLATNAVLMHIFLVAAYFLDGFGAAAEQLVGRALGARYQPAFSQAIKLTAGWGLAVAVLASVVIFAFGEHLIGAITKAADVRAEAALYLPWAAFAAPSGALALQMTGVFVGATWWLDVRNMMLLSFVAFITTLFAFGQLFGNHGLWAAFHIFQLLRGLSLLLVLRRRASTVFA
ncbi:MATE family efflux transporter [Mesorhizobium japonicum]|uniref:DNA-damage-inducible protein n=1 Tax=Mesorhizobium japonicum (strain LMG 29417 / CECT 9101 / MAFF 303099) TaxID=266835 RepID=Q98A08_RHILO|nr:MATE family efflux transporter [Mesorhizobium japonicum]BAB52536.1 DNA-damage-inducible protein [Mesorhizobium japonicum MAFF 303099]